MCRGLLRFIHKDLKLETGYSHQSSENDLVWRAQGCWQSFESPTDPTSLVTYMPTWTKSLVLMYHLFKKCWDMGITWHHFWLHVRIFTVDRWCNQFSNKICLWCKFNLRCISQDIIIFTHSSAIANTNGILTVIGSHKWAKPSLFLCYCFFHLISWNVKLALLLVLAVNLPHRGHWQAKTHCRLDVTRIKSLQIMSGIIH